MLQEEEEYESVSDEITDRLMLLLPWGISALLHAAVVVLAVFAIWSVQTEISEEEVIIPIARLSDNPGAPLTMKLTKQTKESSTQRRTVTKKVTQEVTNLNTKVDTQTTLIGVTGGSQGKASPFGTNIGSGGDFGAGMYGTGGNARRIAYLIDASGSLIDTLPFVIEELKSSISELSERQSFTVIFFQGNDFIEVPPPGLRRASAERKQYVMNWIDPSQGNIIPAGRSNPIPALKRALRYNPQLMFLLSDNITGQGEYEINQRRLLAEIEKANTAGTKINAIQFLYPDRLTQAGLPGTMELIADTSGGTYKFLDGRELGIQ